MSTTFFLETFVLSTSTRMLCACATSCALFLLFGKRFIHFLLEKKIGQPIRDLEDKGFLLAELHKSKKNTPTMGGLLISIITVFSGIIWVNWASPFVFLLFVATILFSIIGGVDDWAKLTCRNSVGISGKKRLFVQTLFAACVIYLLHNSSFEGISLPTISWDKTALSWAEWQKSMVIPFVSNPIVCTSFLFSLFSIFIQWLTIVGAANAVNLTDGLDGLASGCALFVTIFLAIIAFFSSNPQLASLHGLWSIQSSGEIAVYLSGLCGSLIGFLWFNTHPAQVFMGDTGSLAIGGTLGTAAVLLRCEWYLALVGLLFVVETLSVIIQVCSYKLTKKRVFRCAPLHHHFEYAGLHEAKVVVRFWIVALLLLVIALLSLKI